MAKPTFRYDKNLTPEQRQMGQQQLENILNDMNALKKPSLKQRLNPFKSVETSREFVNNVAPVKDENISLMLYDPQSYAVAELANKHFTKKASENMKGYVDPYEIAQQEKSKRAKKIIASNVAGRGLGAVGGGLVGNQLLKGKEYRGLGTLLGAAAGTEAGGLMGNLYDKNVSAKKDYQKLVGKDNYYKADKNFYYRNPAAVAADVTHRQNVENNFTKQANELADEIIKTASEEVKRKSYLSDNINDLRDLDKERAKGKMLPSALGYAGSLGGIYLGSGGKMSNMYSGKTLASGVGGAVAGNVLGKVINKNVMKTPVADRLNEGLYEDPNSLTAEEFNKRVMFGDSLGVYERALK